MRRTSVMAMGFVLIFLGVQMNLVESYTLTPRFSNFLSEQTARTQPQFVNTSANPMVNPNGYGNPNGFGDPKGYGDPNLAQKNSSFYQASYPNAQTIPQPAIAGYAGSKVITTPTWICWPVLFLGTVVFLHGFSMRRNH